MQFNRRASPPQRLFEILRIIENASRHEPRVTFNPSYNLTRYGKQRKAGSRPLWHARSPPYAACLCGQVNSNVERPLLRVGNYRFGSEALTRRIGKRLFDLIWR